VPNSRKENAPVATKEEKTEKEKKVMPQKRKASDELDLPHPVSAQGQGQQQTQVVVLMTTPAKKLKMTSAGQQKEGGSKDDEEGETEGKNAAGRFPHGSFYCHQCLKKRDVSGPFFFFLFFSLPLHLPSFTQSAYIAHTGKHSAN
jgi:hypothetical protein